MQADDPREKKLRDLVEAREKFKQKLADAAAQPVPSALRENWPLVSENGIETGNLKTWMKEMVAWGERVRDDIRRLEIAACCAGGDPGDPPRPPQ